MTPVLARSDQGHERKFLVRLLEQGRPLTRARRERVSLRYVRPMAARLTVAGRTVHDPINVFEEYARRYRRTLAEYDHAEQSKPNEVTLRDLAATRVIASRISVEQAGQIVDRANENHRLLEAIPVDAQLRDADPAKYDGLYDAMSALYVALLGPGVRDSKVSKVLHLKRPSLYPILDSALAKFYRPAAREAASRYPERGFRRMS